MRSVYNITQKLHIFIVYFGVSSYTIMCIIDAYAPSFRHVGPFLSDDWDPEFHFEPAGSKPIHMGSISERTFGEHLLKVNGL